MQIKHELINTKRILLEIKKGLIMKSQFFIMPATLVFLVSCGVPTDMSNMRTVVVEKLALGISQTLDVDTVPIVVNMGLRSALQGAVSSNEGYLSALALEAEAMGGVGVARSILQPQLTGNANIGGIRKEGSNGDDATGVAVGVNLSQLVYDGGASISVVDRSTAQALSAQATRVAQANDIAQNAAQAWIDLWQYSERLRLMNSRTSEMDTLVNKIERVASNGMIDKASLDSAHGQIVDIKLEKSRLQAGQSEAQVLFKRFFHTRTPTVQRPAELVSATQARKFAKNWQNAPALQLIAANLMAGHASVGEAEAAFKPLARASAGVQSPLKRGDPNSLTLGLVLEYSFSDGGRREKQLEAAKARVLATNAQLTDAQRGLQAELQAGLTRLVLIERSIPLLAEKLRLSQSEAKTLRSQMLTGQSNLRQLVEVEIEIYRAQDQQIAMQAERQSILFMIAAGTGALSGLIGLD